MNKLQRLLGVGFITLATTGLVGCIIPPKIMTVKDLTGDGINDIILNISEGWKWNRGTYLFIGQPDGSYITAKESIYRNYFEDMNSERRWFFDGEKYRESFEYNKK